MGRAHNGSTVPTLAWQPSCSAVCASTALCRSRPHSASDRYSAASAAMQRLRHSASSGSICTLSSARACDVSSHVSGVADASCTNDINKCNHRKSCVNPGDVVSNPACKFITPSMQGSLVIQHCGVLCSFLDGFTRHVHRCREHFVGACLRPGKQSAQRRHLHLCETQAPFASCTGKLEKTIT